MIDRQLRPASSEIKANARCCSLNRLASESAEHLRVTRNNGAPVGSMLTYLALRKHPRGGGYFLNYYWRVDRRERFAALETRIGDLETENTQLRQHSEMFSAQELRWLVGPGPYQLKISALELLASVALVKIFGDHSGSSSFALHTQLEPS